MEYVFRTGRELGDPVRDRVRVMARIEEGTSGELGGMILLELEQNM
jgi:hypothetical protein